MNQFVEITYNPDHDAKAILVDRTSKPGTIYLVANKHGMAYLAGLTSDFVLSIAPDELAYVIGEEQGLLPGSPTLVIEFDPSLDQV
jgi:hypothetical protein